MYRNVFISRSNYCDVIVTRRLIIDTSDGGRYVGYRDIVTVSRFTLTARAARVAIDAVISALGSEVYSEIMRLQDGK